MNLLERIDMYLLSEAKTTVSPYLKSVMKKQDAYTSDEIDKLIKGIKSDKSVSLAISTPYTKGKKYLIVKSTDNSDIEDVSNSVSALGYKVKSKKNDGGITYIYFD